jgi:hypothetical protein
MNRRASMIVLVTVAYTLAAVLGISLALTQGGRSLEVAVTPRGVVTRAPVTGAAPGASPSAEPPTRTPAGPPATEPTATFPPPQETIVSEPSPTASGGSDNTPVPTELPSPTFPPPPATYPPPAVTSPPPPVTFEPPTPTPTSTEEGTPAKDPTPTESPKPTEVGTPYPP